MPSNFLTTAEGIMALHDPHLRSLYDLKVRMVPLVQRTELRHGHRYLFSVILISCLLGESNEILRNEDEV